MVTPTHKSNNNDDLDNDNNDSDDLDNDNDDKNDNDDDGDLDNVLRFKQLLEAALPNQSRASLHVEDDHLPYDHIIMLIMVIMMIRIITMIREPGSFARRR